KKAEQRLGGLELLRLLVESKKGVEACRERAQQYQEAHPKPGEQEQGLLDAVLDVHRQVPTLDDALGLGDPGKRSPAVPPRVKKVALLTPATLACLKSLDELIQGHQETPVALPDRAGEDEELLGNLDEWEMPDPEFDEPAEKDALKLPLREVWEKWY